MEQTASTSAAAVVLEVGLGAAARPGHVCALAEGRKGQRDFRIRKFLSATMSDRYTHLPTPQRATAKHVSALHGILEHVSDSVAADEQSVALLLRAFDLEDPNIPATPPYSSPPRTPLSRLRPKQDYTPDSVPRSRHPFLNTPMRNQYFPSLDPLILRELLRSPPDFELSSGLTLKKTPLKRSQSSFPETPEIKVTRTTMNRKSLPTSPFPAFASPSPVTRGPPSSLRLPPHEHQEQDNDDFQTSRVSIKESRRPRAINPEVSSGVIEDFHLVLDEMKGLEPPTTQKSEQSSTNKAKFPCPKPPHAGPLRQEFAAILNDKAEKEEAACKMLRTLADRLESLAKKRRLLIDSV